MPFVYKHIIFLIAIEKKIKCDTEVFDWDYTNQNENQFDISG